MCSRRAWAGGQRGWQRSSGLRLQRTSKRHGHGTCMKRALAHNAVGHSTARASCIALHCIPTARQTWVRGSCAGSTGCGVRGSRDGQSGDATSMAEAAGSEAAARAWAGPLALPAPAAACGNGEVIRTARTPNSWQVQAKHGGLCVGGCRRSPRSQRSALSACAPWPRSRHHTDRCAAA